MPPKRASRAKASSKAEESQDVAMASDAPDAVVPDVAIDADQGSLKSILEKSAKRTRELFAEDQESLYITPTEDQTSQRVKLQSKIYDEYKHVQVLPYPLQKRMEEQQKQKKAKSAPPSGDVSNVDSG
ncbi:hypothetical protein BGZ52_008189, partial [Haplosporangium bisporale]